MAEELASKYDPAGFEDRIYAWWEERGLFHAAVPTAGGGAPYTIVIPPPNVTGVLHMGHGLNNTIQDVLIRYERMRGRATLWVPGTDHAGIATQNVVEKQLAKSGKKRHDLGRETFVEQVWKWKEEHGSTIIRQLRKLGASCDWERERFTMDEGLSRAVREVFVRLHEQGLIYKGQYIINWCPRCGTALSDEEAEHEEKDGTFTHIRYPFADGGGDVVVATTRPETMLGDTAVAVHPDDGRYKGLVGRQLALPLTGRTIPLIADHHVDKEFGTGAVKVTPAHDPNDFEIGNRHDLPRVNVMHGDATMNDNAPEKYRGLDRFACRKAVVADLEAGGYIVKQEPHRHAVGHCYRCHTVVEPYLSEQWFVKMGPLAAPALKAVEDGEITIYPERWKKVYINWMTGIRDWCISRQIWWGHRIPAFTCDACGKVHVAREDVAACPDCGGKTTQDSDVLDTWFSSWLWPFSTLGWPDETPELKHFYPTSTLVTDMGIIFFWVARMIMAGYFCMGKAPFKDVYIHGTVMDEQGRKMSKSLGNGIDPLDVIREYGADALRYTVIALTPQGQNTLLSTEKFKIGSRFANKLWNASRYLLMNVGDGALPDPAAVERQPEDRWIASRLARTAAEVEKAMREFRLNDALAAASHFFWDDYCDWYLEFTKRRLYGDDEAAKRGALSLLVTTLGESLKLLHPFTPFITEEIWRKLSAATGRPDTSLLEAAYPADLAAQVDESVERSMVLVQEMISSLRNVRAELKVPADRQCELVVKAADAATEETLRAAEPFVRALARVSAVAYDRAAAKPPAAAAGVGSGYEFFVPLGGLIDLDAERARLGKERDKLALELERVRTKLANGQFTASAPAAVVEKEKEKAAGYEETIARLAANLAALGGP